MFNAHLLRHPLCSLLRVHLQLFLRAISPRLAQGLCSRSDLPYLLGMKGIGTIKTANAASSDVAPISNGENIGTGVRRAGRRDVPLGKSMPWGESELRRLQVSFEIARNLRLADDESSMQRLVWPAQHRWINSK
jgi:hypothetical protein